MRPISLKCNGMTFSGLDAGPPDGPLVILLHGFPQTSRAWGAQLQALADAGFHAVAPDMRGFADGARPLGVEQYTLALAVDDVLAIAAELGGEADTGNGSQGFHLAGHDLGGIVAWELACRAPEHVRTLTIASTPHLAPFGQAIIDGSAERLPPFELFRQDGVAEQLMLSDGGNVLRQAYTGLAPDAIEEYVRCFSAPGVLTATLAYFRAFDFDAWLALAQCTAPTLFAWGRDDPFLAAATASATAAHVSGSYREEPLDGVGHWVPELAAERMSELLLEQVATG
jgi:pimeloyl-ACP methyl ester carboxylesterase